MAPRLPLSALLSQAVVAFTIEFDNEFERRMGDRGHAGARLSLVVWANLFRFIVPSPPLPPAGPPGGASVRDLTAVTFGGDARVRLMLGCLERWGFVTIGPAQTETAAARLPTSRKTSRVLRQGWGSARGIRAEWLVRPTAKGRDAEVVWPGLFNLIEERWCTRFGDDAMGRLRASLEVIVAGLDIEVPDAVPEPSASEDRERVGPRQTKDTHPLPLVTLLSRALSGFATEFNRQSETPLAFSANVIRVLNEKGVRVSELPLLTGTSREAGAIGWRLKRDVAVQSEAKAGKVARLTAHGLDAQRTYLRLVDAIETGWERRFGADGIRRLRTSLEHLFVASAGGHPLMSEGLWPPAGVARAGGEVPALGRRDVGAAARQRTRDLVAQTKALIDDPGGRLPHYPLWDMNRGFGP